MVATMQRDEHQAVDRLLPWYINGTLTPDEHDRVRRHVDGCTACRETISLLSMVQSSVRHDTATPIVRPLGTEKLLGDIDNLERRIRHRRFLTRSLMAASVAAVVLVGALLPASRDTSDPEPALFETTTSTSPAISMDYVLDVQFETGTTLAEQTRLLRSLGAEYVDRDEPNAVYRVTVSLPAASLEELEQYMNDVRALPQIRSADVVALQLPMKRRE